MAYSFNQWQYYFCIRCATSEQFVSGGLLPICTRRNTGNLTEASVEVGNAGKAAVFGTLDNRFIKLPQKCHGQFCPFSGDIIPDGNVIHLLEDGGEIAFAHLRSSGDDLQTQIFGQISIDEADSTV